MILSEMGCNDLFFCKDGFIKAFVNEKILEPEQKFSNLIDIQNKFKKTDMQKTMFFLSFLNNKVILEEDLTFGEFIQCLIPWEKEISALMSINAKSFFDSVFDDSVDSNKYSPEEYRIQILNVGSAFRDIYREPSKSRIKLLKSLGLEEKKVDLEKVGKWKGDYFSDINKSQFSLVNYNDEENLVWSSIFEGFYGYKDLKISCLKSMYLFFQEDNFKGEDVYLTAFEQSSEKVHQNYQILKLNGSYNSHSLNDLLVGLFGASPELCVPVSANTMMIKEMLSDENLNSNISAEEEEISRETLKNHYKKINKSIKLLKEELVKSGGIEREDINKFKFDYSEDDNKKYVFSSAVFKSKK